MYVGAVPTTGDFKILDSITTSSSTTFNLRQGGVAVYPQSANHCLVVLNGVLQTAGSSFNIVNDTIVFASSLSSSDVINQILVLGNVNDIGVPSDDTVSTAKIQANAVTAAKFNADVISGQTELAAEPADTDEFLVSDAGVLKRIDYSHIKGGATHVLLNDTYVSSATTSITWDSSLITDTYEQYILTGSGIQMRDNANGNLNLNYSQDNGSNYENTSGDYLKAIYVNQTSQSNNTMISRNGDDTAVPLTGPAYDFGGGVAYGGGNFVARMYNLRNLDTGSGMRRHCTFTSSYQDRSSADGVTVFVNGTVIFKGFNGEVNNIKLSVSNSNAISEGEFRLYGVA